MTQHTDVALPELTYNRTDYTALRAYVLKIPIQRIADLYYTEDSPQVEQGLERWLIAMRNALVERAIEHNPAFAEILKGARQGGAITDKALDILIKAADMPRPAPSRLQPLAQWFRPKTARALKDEGVQTLGDLVDLIVRRGPGWWRSIPRIGAGRAAAILRWLRQWPNHLGEIDLDGAHAAPVADFGLLPVLDPTKRRDVAPFGTFQLPAWLSGLQGANRSPAFCFISARTDLEAINAYLTRYRGQTHTERAYRKELERFILWCALVACKPMSSLLVDDCDAYKNFLRAPLSEFCGPRAPRTSKRWKPFAEGAMSADSQKYAVQVLRSMFDWLVKVRYLAGNPWAAVKDPVVVQQAEDMQDRVALAAILLMGDSGLRRAEVAGARRHNLKPSRHASAVWMLSVLGKRSTVRKVPVSTDTLSALRAHWRDRGLDFDGQADDLPLLAPIIVPRTEKAQVKHVEEAGHGYHPESLYRLVTGALRRVREHAAAHLSEGSALLTIEEISQLRKTSPHAFRHTFGTLAVEDEMPLVVVQEILGHKSASTTSIYVKAKEKRIAEAAEDYYSRKGETVNQGRTGPKNAS
jgi:site-specific recombinase XerD